MRILVTAGPTREFFDSVRFISNSSSGKMGYAVAAEAARRGHKVDLVSGPVELPAPKGVKVTRVVTAQEMFEAATALFPRCRAAIMTAAVCDYRPASRLDHKLKKSRRPRSLRLVPTPDILAHLGTIKGRRVLIGFAMEDHDEHRRAEAKLRRKRCDAIVLNGLRNVGGDRATVQVFRPDAGWDRPVSGTKPRIARLVMDLVERLGSDRTTNCRMSICDCRLGRSMNQSRERQRPDSHGAVRTRWNAAKSSRSTSPSASKSKASQLNVDCRMSIVE